MQIHALGLESPLVRPASRLMLHLSSILVDLEEVLRIYPSPFYATIPFGLTLVLEITRDAVIPDVVEATVDEGVLPGAWKRGVRTDTSLEAHSMPRTGLLLARWPV